MPAVSTASASCSPPRAAAHRRRSCHSLIRRLRRYSPSGHLSAEGEDMNEIAQPHGRLLWQRIVEFPLVAMIVALLLYVFASAVGLYLGKFVSIGQPATTVVHAAISLVLVLATYKLAIVRLGEPPRDDLRAAGSLP